MMVKRKLIAGNWKMNANFSSNEALVGALLQGLSELKNQAGPDALPEVLVCPPAPYLAQVGALLNGSGMALGAQDVNEHDKGAYTGEVSTSMLKEFNVSHVILGHSERRRYQFQTDSAVCQKVVQTLQSGLTPIVCVGETQDEREQGQTQAVIKRQVMSALSMLTTDFEQVVVAYEPVWAIGTGLTATPQMAQEVHAYIRSLIETRTRHAKSLKILYGGSMNASNAQALLAQPDVDGGLIGSAALSAPDFLSIISAAMARNP
jgi:triosephosphate isomerase (TIM)